MEGRGTHLDRPPFLNSPRCVWVSCATQGSASTHFITVIMWTYDPLWTSGERALILIGCGRYQRATRTRFCHSRGKKQNVKRLDIIHTCMQEEANDYDFVPLEVFDAEL